MKKVSFHVIFAMTINFALFFSLNAWAQAPSIEWQKCLGGVYHEEEYSFQQTSDSGYIIAGYTFSNDGDVTGLHGIPNWYSDYWIVKIDSARNIQWQKCLGGTEEEVAYSIRQASDGGYIIAGYTNSSDADVTGNHGNNDYWVVKLDTAGNIQWQKCLGGMNGERAYSAQQTSDSGYIIAGYTQSNDADVLGNHGYYDYWIVKLDTVGTIQWQKCLGGTNEDMAKSIQQTADSGYIVVGYTLSNDSDVTGLHGTAGSYADCWVVKLDTAGNIEWQKCLGGTKNDEAESIQQTTDGGYIVAGHTNSEDGDVIGLHSIPYYYCTDYWIVKLDTAGTIQWQKCLGGTSNDVAYSIQQTSDSGYIVAGYAGSADGDVSGNHGYDDYWIVKLDTAGNIEWQKCLGGDDNDRAKSVQQTTDGNYIVAGDAGSNNGDVANNHGGYGVADYWIVKLTFSPVDVEDINSFSDVKVYPNPFSDFINIDFPEGYPRGDIKLMNLLGQIVLQKNLQNGKNLLSGINIPVGVYILWIQDSNDVLSKSIVVKE